MWTPMESEGWQLLQRSLCSHGQLSSEQKLYIKNTVECRNEIIFWADLLDIKLVR